MNITGPKAPATQRAPAGGCDPTFVKSEYKRVLL